MLLSIKSSVQIEKFKTGPYLFSVGDYDVAMITPIVRYRHYAAELRAAKEKAKRKQSVLSSGISKRTEKNLN